MMLDNEGITMKSNQKGFGAIEGLLVLIIIGLVGFIGYYVYHTKNSTNSTYNNAAKTNSNVADQSKNGINLSRDYLPFSLSYPANWEIGSETPTNYGFYSIHLQAKGTVIETGRGGAELKSGAELMLIKTSDKATNPENTIEEYASSNLNAKFFKDEKTITLDGVKALEYDLDRTSDGGTSGHQVLFYKDGVQYSFDMDNTQYGQQQYKDAFQSIVHSVKFK
jgi:hypothetical protein